MMALMRSKKGASSVLVILMLVVLVVFGVAALTTALSSVRLGQKVSEFNAKYYAAEALANEVYARIDQRIEAGEQSAPGDRARHIAASVAALSYSIDTDVGQSDIDFTYETWEQDVGLRVTLRYDLQSQTLSPTQWKQILKQQQEIAQ